MREKHNYYIRYIRLLILSDAIGARSPLRPALRCNYRLWIWLRMGETNWCHALLLHISLTLCRSALGFTFLAFAACDECLGPAAHRRQPSYATTIMTQRISNSPRLNNNTQRGALAMKLWMNSTHYRLPIRHPNDNCCAAKKKQHALTANRCWSEISTSLGSEMIIASTIICILHIKLTWNSFRRMISANAWRQELERFVARVLQMKESDKTGRMMSPILIKPFWDFQMQIFIHHLCAFSRTG